MEQPRRFYRIRKDKAIGGVCSGLSSYFKIELTLVRVIFFIGTLFTAFLYFPILYLVLWIIAPMEPKPEPESEKSLLV